METNEIHWRDRLALRIMAWIASVLMTDAIEGEERADFDALCTSINVETGARYHHG